MKTPLCRAASLLIGASGATWSIDNGWPAAFGRGFLPFSLALHGDSQRVARESLGWRGTAIAPPLSLLAVLEPMGHSLLWGPTITPIRAVFRAALALGALLGVVGYAERRRKRVPRAEAVPA